MTSRRALSLGDLSIRSVIPNAVTLLAFICGLTSVRFALVENWGAAVSAIVIAGVLDGLDGTIARLLKSTSRFGAELDSLSDNVAFGVAPAILIYLYTLHGLGRLGWAAALIFSVAMALRLARFNARLGMVDEPRQRLGYLTGVPAPAGAALMVSPILADLTFEGAQVRAEPEWVAGYTILLAILMVSTIPTLSPRLFRLRRDWFVPLLFGIAAVLAGLFVHSWAVLLLLGVLYLATLPLTAWTYHRRRRQKSKR